MSFSINSLRGCPACGEITSRSYRKCHMCKAELTPLKKRENRKQKERKEMYPPKQAHANWKILAEQGLVPTLD